MNQSLFNSFWRWVNYCNQIKRCYVMVQMSCLLVEQVISVWQDGWRKCLGNVSLVLTWQKFCLILLSQREDHIRVNTDRCSHH